MLKTSPLPFSRINIWNCIRIGLQIIVGWLMEGSLGREKKRKEKARVQPCLPQGTTAQTRFPRTHPPQMAPTHTLSLNNIRWYRVSVSLSYAPHPVCVCIYIYSLFSSHPEHQNKTHHCIALTLPPLLHSLNFPPAQAATTSKLASYISYIIRKCRWRTTDQTLAQGHGTSFV